MFKKLFLLVALALPALAEYDDPAHLPAKTDAAHGQTGYNDCISRYGASSQKSKCQNVFVNSVKDFCLWGPPKPNSNVGDTEEEQVAWCTKSGYGTRLIPDGTLTGVHFLKTGDFVQVTGTGDLTKLNIRQGDEGGELDPHGATGAGNPVGGLVFTRAITKGKFQRIYEWNNFMDYQTFCIRGCFGKYRTKFCPHIYDLLGCNFSEPANYSPGVFEQCDGDSGQFPGIYGSSTFYQGQEPTPAPHPAGTSSNCRQYPTVSNGPAAYIPSRRDVYARETPVPRAAEAAADE